MAIKSNVPRRSIAHSQFVLMCAAGHVDKEMRIEEKQEIMALAMRTPTLTEVPRETLERLFDEIGQAAAQGELPRWIQIALHNIPTDPAFALSLYAHCCDIVHADRRIDPREVAYLDMLAKALRIDAAKRRRVDRVIAWKNRH